MNLGKYEIETYYVVLNGQTETRERIIYIHDNNEDIFIERYYGVIREGYKGSNTHFKNLAWTNIKSHIVGESIVVNDNGVPSKPLIYFSISSIESVQRDGDTKLVVVDNQIDPITLEFISVFDADQTYSIFNLVLQDPNTDIGSLSMDITPPIIFFNEFFFGEVIKVDSNLKMALSGPFSTDDGSQFIIDINYDSFEGPKPITKTDVMTGMIYDITDNRDGSINLLDTDVFIYKDIISSENLVNEISGPGNYICKFNLHDLGQNQNNSTIVLSIV